ncbi:MAG TPA: DUF892 family protein [Chloroflexota bacterium]
MAVQVAVRSARDLFVYDLSVMYDAEQTILQMLRQIRGECQNQQLVSAVQQHEQETQHQIQNLEECFRNLGMQPQRVPCHAVQGIVQDHRVFVQQGPPSDVLELYDVGAGYKTEHFEIAAYRGMVEKASLMGEQTCARLLQENLQQEENMAKRLEQAGSQISRQMIGGMRM